MNPGERSDEAIDPFLDVESSAIKNARRKAAIAFVTFVWRWHGKVNAFGRNPAQHQLALNPLAAGKNASDLCNTQLHQLVPWAIAQPMEQTHTTILMANPPCRHVTKCSIGQQLRTDRADAFVIRHREHDRYVTARMKNRGRKVVREHVDENDVGLEFAQRFSDHAYRKRIYNLEQGLRCLAIGSEGCVFRLAVTCRAGAARDQPNFIARFPKSVAQPRHVCFRSALPTIPVGYDDDTHRYITTSLPVTISHRR